MSSVALWPASLALLAVVVRLALPVHPFSWLVLAGVAGCAVAGWARGGSFVSAALAVLVLCMVLWRAAGFTAVSTTALFPFSIGWVLLVAATFGWLSVASGNRAFLGRALAAVLIAGTLTLLVLAFRSDGGSSGVAQMSQVFDQELDRRRGVALAQWDERRAAPSWTAMDVRFPSVVRSADAVARWMETVPTPTVLVPALLLIESLAALAMAWALWHRLARFRLGPPLSPLSEFRFNDQLVWGLVAGATLVLLPTLSAWRGVGVNLLLLFGALYALRGVGVLLWWLPDRWAWLPLLLLLVCIPLLGPVQVLATVAVLAFGVGLGDTWRDFRRTARPLRPDVRP